MAVLFGNLFRELRIKRGDSLREYCRNNKKDPAFISRMERGLVPPPTNREELSIMAHSLGIKEHTVEWDNFFNSAIVSAGKIPSEIMDDESKVEKLPLLFRTVTGKKLSPEELESLARILLDK